MLYHAQTDVKLSFLLFMGFDEHAACARSGLIAEAWTLEPEPEFRVLSLK